MNAAVTAALIAAQQEGETPDVLAQLTKLGATSIDKAVPFVPANEKEAKQRDDQIAAGLIGRASGARLYVNQRAVDERNASAGYGVLIALLVLGSIAASVIALLAFA